MESSIKYLKRLLGEASSAGTSQERLAHLASLHQVNTSTNLLTRVLQNPAAGPKILLEWIEKRPGLVLKHPNCPIEELFRWAETNNSYGHLSIVKNPRCPAEILVKLLKRYDNTKLGMDMIKSEIESLIMSHPNFPEDLGEWALGLGEW